MRSLDWVCAATLSAAILIGSSPSTAWAGSISRGESLTGIDAALDEAAGVTDTVTDAETGQPLDGIEVCAIEVGGEEISRCRYSSGDGCYLVGGLPSARYYDNAPTRAEPPRC
jgi:hypothetical protein